MTPEPSVVELFVGPDARRVDVFDRYTVDVSMLEVGTAFTFSFWYSDVSAEAPWRVLVDRETGIKCGHRVNLAIDGTLVLSGVIETRTVGDSEGREGPVFAISGRDMLGGAVSWDADPTLTFAGRRLEDALAELYRGVGIVPEVSLSVQEQQRTTEAAVTHRNRVAFARRTSELQAKAAMGNAAAKADLKRLLDHGPSTYGITRTKHPRVGEKVQQVVERIVRGLGYRVWTAPSQGDRTVVVVDRPRTTGDVFFRLTRTFVDGRVTAESNIVGGKESSSIANVPATVTVFADAPRGDAVSSKIERTSANDFLAAPAGRARVATDAPPRPRYVESTQARTPEAAHNEAARICARANEGFRRYECTVLGHRWGGLLWTPNTRVAVRDELLGIDETMLLVAVTYEGSKEGSQKTRLTLLPEGALTELPESEAS